MTSKRLFSAYAPAKYATCDGCKQKILVPLKFKGVWTARTWEYCPDCRGGV